MFVIDLTNSITFAVFIASFLLEIFLFYKIWNWSPMTHEFDERSNFIEKINELNKSDPIDVTFSQKDNWLCKNCSTKNELSYEICYNCSTERDLSEKIIKEDWQDTYYRQFVKSSMSDVDEMDFYITPGTHMRFYYLAVCCFLIILVFLIYSIYSNFTLNIY